MALVVAMLLAGCSGSHTATADGGRDGGRDGGKDAGRDAGAREAAAQDAGHDAGPPDGGPDAGVADPGWVPMGGLPDGCVVERAQHPEALFTPHWDACPGGVTGCLELRDDPRFNRNFDGQTGAHDPVAGRGYVEVVEHERADPEDRRIVVLASTQGAPLAAWRDPVQGETSLCMLGIVGVSAEAAAFEIMSYGDHWPNQSRIYHAPLDAIGAVSEPEAVLRPPGTSVVQNIAVSASTVAATVQPAGLIMVMDRGAVRQLGGAGSAVPGIPQGVRVVGHQVLWEDWEDTVRIAHGSIDQAASIYYAAAGADLKSFHTDGQDLMWLKGWNRESSGHYDNLELWTAPYTPDAESLELRKAIDYFPVRVSGAFGAGVFGIRLIDPIQRAELYDHADGRRRTFPMPGGCALLFAPLYISAHDMLLVAACPGHKTLFRVDPSALPYDP